MTQGRAKGYEAEYVVRNRTIERPVLDSRNGNSNAKKMSGNNELCKATHRVMTANWISGFLEIGLT